MVKAYTNLLTKISSIINDIYILKTGYGLSMDSEKPFLIQLGSGDMEFFKQDFRDFKMIHINNIKKFKVITDDNERPQSEYVSIVELKSEYDAVVDRLQTMLNEIGKHEVWSPLILSEEDIDKIYNKRSYIIFKPEDSEADEIILTKSFFPMVTAKTTDIIAYSSRVVSDDMFSLVLSIGFPLFQVYAVHYYIKINTDLLK